MDEHDCFDRMEEDYSDSEDYESDSDMEADSDNSESSPQSRAEPHKANHALRADPMTSSPVPLAVQKIESATVEKEETPASSSLDVVEGKPTPNLQEHTSGVELDTVDIYAFSRKETLSHTMRVLVAIRAKKSILEEASPALKGGSAFLSAHIVTFSAYI